MRTNLGRIRVARSLRRVDVASLSGTSLKVIQRLESGDVLGMRVRTLLQVAQGLHVSVSDLVPGLGVRFGKGTVEPDELVGEA